MGQPINIFVELLVVVDNSILKNQQRFISTNDSGLVYQATLIYYSHFFNGVLHFFTLLSLLYSHIMKLSEKN